jgi:ribosomal protein S18 acetylase RimI-like enzyme
MHVQLLPHGLFPRLGHGFVRRWHRTFIDSGHAQAICVRADGGRVVGFLLGTTNNALYAADVLTDHRGALAARGAAALAVRPGLAQDFARTRLPRYARRLAGSGRPSRPGGPPGGQVAVVHALVTLPEQRGRGIGRLLVEHFEGAVSAAATPLVQLVTREQDGAGQFYLKLGYVVTDRRPDKDGVTVVQLDKPVG